MVNKKGSSYPAQNVLKERFHEPETDKDNIKPDILNIIYKGLFNSSGKLVCDTFCHHIGHFHGLIEYIVKPFYRSLVVLFKHQHGAVGQ